MQAMYSEVYILCTHCYSVRLVDYKAGSHQYFSLGHTCSM